MFMPDNQGEWHLYEINEQAERMVRNIMEELGDRMGYIEKAYRFPDRLRACACQVTLQLEPIGRDNDHLEYYQNSLLEMTLVKLG